MEVGTNWNIRLPTQFFIKIFGFFLGLKLSLLPTLALQFLHKQYILTLVLLHIQAPVRTVLVSPHQ